LRHPFRWGANRAASGAPSGVLEAQPIGCEELLSRTWTPRKRGVSSGAGVSGKWGGASNRGDWISQSLGSALRGPWVDDPDAEDGCLDGTRRRQFRPERIARDCPDVTPFFGPVRKRVPRGPRNTLKSQDSGTGNSAVRKGTVSARRAPPRGVTSLKSRVHTVYLPGDDS